MRSRRDIQSIAKYNLSTAKMVKVHEKEKEIGRSDILQLFSDSGIPRPWREYSTGCGITKLMERQSTIVPALKVIYMTEVIYSLCLTGFVGADALEEIGQIRRRLKIFKGIQPMSLLKNSIERFRIE